MVSRDPSSSERRQTPTRRADELEDLGAIARRTSRLETGLSDLSGLIADHPHPELDRRVAKIQEILEGPLVEHIDGAGPDRHVTRGVQKRVEVLDQRTARIEAKLSNGLSLKLGLRELVKLGALLGGLILGAVIALGEILSNHPLP